MSVIISNFRISCTLGNYARSYSEVKCGYHPKHVIKGWIKYDYFIFCAKVSNISLFVA